MVLVLLSNSISISICQPPRVTCGHDDSDVSPLWNRNVWWRADPWNVSTRISLVINSVDKANNFICFFSHWCSSTVSLETNLYTVTILSYFVFEKDLKDIKHGHLYVQNHRLVLRSRDWLFVSVFFFHHFEFHDHENTKLNYEGETKIWYNFINDFFMYTRLS